MAWLLQAVKYAYKKHRLLSNTATCGTLLGLGDAAQQCIGIYVNENGKPFDWTRTSRMAFMGTIIGPMNHFWYRWLDGMYPKTDIATVFRKVLYDQANCPVFSGVFVVGTSLLEGKKLNDALDEYGSKFLSIYKLDWSVWPTAQLINFWLVPPHFRILYNCTISLGYNSVMSYIKHEEGNYMPYNWQDADSLHYNDEEDLAHIEEDHELDIYS